MQELKYTTIKKLVFGGQGLGHDHEGKVTFIYNALPGEEVGFYITKVKKNYFEGIAEEIVKPSPDRISALEPEQFLSTSPWQILSWEKELEWKEKIAHEAFFKVNDIPPQIELAATPKPQYEYRNKMEFSFTEDTNGKISLALFKRGSKRKIPITGSKLAEPIINEIVQSVCDWLNTQALTANDLKVLIVRSNGQGQGIAALFLTKEAPDLFEIPTLTSDFLGFKVYYSNPKSPAAVPTKLLYSSGQDYLIATIDGFKLKFGLLSFFQVNIPLFQETLNDLKQFIPKNSDVVDYYSGVGAIGLPLAPNLKSLIMVDNNAEAISYAQDNIALNKIPNAKAKCLPSEKITDLIEPHKTIILDPPRAGLHPKMIKQLLAKLPQQIIYLSCNLSTQARDLEHLQDHYKLSFIKLYNFFPRTPHIECLCVLERR